MFYSLYLRIFFLFIMVIKKNTHCNFIFSVATSFPFGIINALYTEHNFLCNFLNNDGEVVEWLRILLSIYVILSSILLQKHLDQVYKTKGMWVKFSWWKLCRSRSESYSYSSMINLILLVLFTLFVPCVSMKSASLQHFEPVLRSVDKCFPSTSSGDLRMFFFLV